MRTGKCVFILILSVLFLESCQTRVPLLDRETGEWQDRGPQERVSEKEANRLVKQGLESYNQGDMRGAIRAWEASLAMFQELALEPQVSTNLSNLGFSHQRLGEFARAREYFEEALAMDIKRNDHQGQRDNLRRSGFALYNLGDFYQAQQCFDKALAIDQRLGDKEGWMIELTHLANVLWHQGKYSEAQRHYKDLQERAKDVKDGKREADALVGIGLIHEELGRYEKAMACYQNAVEIYRAQGWEAGEEVALNNLGFVQSTLGRYAEALDYYRQALVICKARQDLKGEGQVTSNIGQVHAAFEKYPQALDYLYHALQIRKKLGDKQGQALDQIRVGMVYEAIDNIMLAERNYQEGLALARLIGRPETVWRAHYRLGGLHEKEDQWTEALHDYQKAVATIESMVGLLSDREDRQGFLESRVDVYVALIQVLFQLHRQDADQGYDAAALTYCEKLRGLKRRKRLDSVEVPFQDLKRQAFFDRQRRLRAKIQKTEERLSHERAKKESLKNQELIYTLERLKGELKADFKKFVDTLKEEDPYFLTWISVDPTRLGAIQTLLGQTEAILEYYITDRYTYIFVVKAEGLFIEYVNVDAVVLEANITNLRSFVQNAGFEAMEHADYVKSISRELYDILIGPVEALLQGKQILGILPNRKLHYLPFQLLIHDTAEAEERFLVEDHSIFYLNTKGLLNLSRKEQAGASGPSESFVAFANADGTLPHAEEEVLEVAEDYADSRVFVRNRATEHHLKRWSPDSRLLHIATHGQLDYYHPQDSYISLYPGQDEDGRLTLDEIYGLDLAGTDLVTLSACETAMGRLAAGDEVVALSEAFLFAGAPTVVASLWRVDDRSTALLMKGYYGYLRSGADKLAALRLAQIDLMNIRAWDEKDDLPVDYSHPHYWAPFILIGQYR